MKDIFKIIGSIIGILLIVITLSWIAIGNDLFMYKFFAPKQEQVRREVFEQTKSFNDGMKQELQQMQIDYAKGNEDTKNSISSIVIHRYSTYKKELNGDMLSFYNECLDRQTKIK
jgi:hypothetical protein